MRPTMVRARLALKRAGRSSSGRAQEGFERAGVS
jgi:hypothetical protein